MKIIIAGYGVVGKAVANALKDHYEVVVMDPQYTDYKMIDHRDAAGIIVCVGTPTTPSGVCDSRDICGVLDDVPLHMPVMIKSTITPAVIEALETIYPNHSICYSPEFLRKATANQDFLNQKFMVLGGGDIDGFWQDLFTPVLEKCKMYFFCSMLEASIIKYTTNSFLATKVAFFNQIYDLCQAGGADYDIVRQIVTHDLRIGTSHTMVPGVDGNRGFGGACFPKDTKAFGKYAKDLNKPVSILNSAMDYNETVRTDVDNQQS